MYFIDFSVHPFLSLFTHLDGTRLLVVFQSLGIHNSDSNSNNYFKYNHQIMVKTLNFIPLIHIQHSQFLHSLANTDIFFSVCFFIEQKKLHILTFFYSIKNNLLISIKQTYYQ